MHLNSDGQTAKINPVLSRILIILANEGAKM